METTGKNFKSVLVLILAAFIMVAVVPGFKAEARAGAGAFLGGMVAGHLISGAVQRDKIQTAAAVESASQPKTQTVYVQQAPAATTSQPQASAQQAPAQAAKPSVEQRIKELDKLAKDGYITPEEYKARKKAIIDSI